MQTSSMNSGRLVIVAKQCQVLIVDSHTMAMDRAMEIGERVPVPSSLQMPAGWVEMRRIWSAKSSNMLAILFRVIEMYQANPSFGMPESFFTPKQIENIRRKKEDLKSDLGFLVELTEGMLHPIDFIHLYQNPLQVEMWGLKLVFPADNAVINAPGSVKIALYMSGEHLFLLYSAYSLGNFVNLECGHLAFKYDYYQRLQQIAQGTAVSLNDMEGFGLVCFDCNKPVSPSLLFPQVSAKKPVSTFQYAQSCQACGSLKPPNSRDNCPQQHRLCESCFLKNCLSDNYLYTPCCQEATPPRSLNAALKIMRSRPTLSRLIETLPHLQCFETLFVPDRYCAKCKRVLKGDESSLVCTSCEMEQQTSRFCLEDGGSSKKRFCAKCRRVLEEDESSLVCTSCEMEQQTSRFCLEDEGSSKEPRPKISNVAVAYPLVQSSRGANFSGETDDLAENHTKVLSQSAQPELHQREKANQDSQRNPDVPQQYQTNPYVPPHSLPALDEERKESFPPVIHSPPTSDPASSGTRCRLCKVSYTQQDRDWQCSKRCYCSLCMAALVIGNNRMGCFNCNIAVSEELMERLRQKWVRCHSCGLAMAWNELVKGIECNVCKACVAVTANVKSREIKCYQCNCVYSANEGDYEGVKRLPVTLQRSACCNFSISSLPFKKLRCNHLVCFRHFHVLKRCRNCHQPAVVVEDR